MSCEVQTRPVVLEVGGGKHARVGAVVLVVLARGAVRANKTALKRLMAVGEDKLADI